jgi:MFS family permease
VTPASDSPPETPPSAYSVFLDRDYRLYISGRFLAASGYLMFNMAVGWELYERTRRPMALALVGLTLVLPMALFTLPAGHFADHHERKKIIAWASIIVALCSFVLMALSANQLPYQWTYLCLFIVGGARTFQRAATASYLPQLVERRLLARAVTWESSQFQIASIIGPVTAGYIVQHTGKAAVVYAIHAALALGCAVLIGMIRKASRINAREEMSFKTLLTGFNFVFHNRVILGILTLDMLAVLLGGATALLPVYAKEILHVGPAMLGVLQTALPVGSVICSFILAHRPPLQKAGRALLWAVAAFGLATIGFGLSQWFWLSFAMLLLCGASDNVSVVVRHTLVQLLTPDDKRGRVSAVNNLFIGTSNELGEFESGAVAELAIRYLGVSIAGGAMISVVGGGVGTILVVIGVAWYWPEIRRYGRLDA